MNPKLRLLFPLSFLIILSCDSTNSPPLNPNGDSELALLMREMYEDGMKMKAQLDKGIKPKVQKKFSAILSAEATEPAKVQTKDYETFANSYLSSLSVLAKADISEAKINYHSMVESCMNCHKAMCPGPIVKIKKMYMPRE